MSFQYLDDHPVLKQVDIAFDKNELVPIVGPTGSGKTTVAYLIPGFLRPTEGRVLIDGTDINSVNVDSLRDQVTYAFQEHLLLSQSIRENLRLARPDAVETEMWAALETAGASDFVAALPDGLDTVLGRAGDTLSV